MDGYYVQYVSVHMERRIIMFKDMTNWEKEELTQSILQLIILIGGSIAFGVWLKSVFAGLFCMFAIVAYWRKA